MVFIKVFSRLNEKVFGITEANIAPVPSELKP